MTKSLKKKMSVYGSALKKHKIVPSYPRTQFWSNQSKPIAAIVWSQKHTKCFFQQRQDLDVKEGTYEAISVVFKWAILTFLILRIPGLSGTHQTRALSSYDERKVCLNLSANLSHMREKREKKINAWPCCHLVYQLAAGLLTWRINWFFFSWGVSRGRKNYFTMKNITSTIHC